MITYKKNPSSRQPRRTRSQGAVVVEVCFLFPFLVWITFSILQYGLILWKEVELTNLTRDAMRYLAVTGVQNNGNTTDNDYSAPGTPPSTNSNSVYLYIENECSGTGIAYSDLTVAVKDYTQSSSGTTIAQGATTSLPIAQDRVGVTLTYTMTTSNTIFLNGLVPGMSIWLGTPQPRTCEMIMENQL